MLIYGACYEMDVQISYRLHLSIDEKIISRSHYFIKQLCSYKGVEIIEGHLMPDHIHMLTSTKDSAFMGYLKGKKCAYDFDKHGINLEIVISGQKDITGF